MSFEPAVPLADIAVQIVHRDDLDALRALLASIHTAENFHDSQGARLNEVRVFDDASHPSVADAVERLVQKERAIWGDRLVFVRSAAPREWGRAHSELMSRSGAKYILVLEPRMSLPQDFFFALQNQDALHPEASCFYLPVVIEGRRAWAGGAESKFFPRFQKLKPADIATRDHVPAAPLIVPVKPFERSGGWGVAAISLDAGWEISSRLVQQRGWEVSVLQECLVEIPGLAVVPATSAETRALFRHEQRVLSIMAEKSGSLWRASMSRAFFALRWIGRAVMHTMSGRFDSVPWILQELRRTVRGP